ncbi:MAG: flavodoxin family protein [Candidatus Thorarchaeota archaeon]
MYEENEINVLGIIGSPRRNGNTEILVDEILLGAAECGVQIGKIILEELNIAPCKACNLCKNGGACVQDDDMSALLEMMDNSQVWVLGTPIYWWGPTAQMKAFVDRWYGSNHTKFQNKRVILALPLGGSKEESAHHTIGMFRSAMDYLGMKHVTTVIAPGVHKRGAIREKNSVLKIARDAGRLAIETLDVVQGCCLDQGNQESELNVRSGYNEV